MHNYYSAYGLATHILIKKRHWSVRLSVYLSVGLSVCLPICLTVCLCVCLSVRLSTVEQVKDKTTQELYSYHPQKKDMKKKTTVLLTKGTSHLENSWSIVASNFLSPEGTIPNDTQRVSRALPFLTIPIFTKLLLLLSFRKKWKKIATCLLGDAKAYIKMRRVLNCTLETDFIIFTAEVNIRLFRGGHICWQWTVLSVPDHKKIEFLSPLFIRNELLQWL